MKKLIGLSIGVVLSLMILEVSIPLAYKVFEYGQNSGNQSNRNSRKRTVTILSVGESTTAVAANEDNSLLVKSASYPTQLAEVLNSSQDEIFFRVINKGIMGGNTNQILGQLNDNIKTYSPDIIVAMMGHKDYKGMPGAPEEDTPPRSGNLIMNLLNKSHSYNFFCLVYDHLSGKNRDIDDSKFVKSVKDIPLEFYSSTSYKAKEELDNSNGEKLRQLKRDGLYNELHAKLSFTYYLNFTGQYDRAIKLLQHMIKEHNIGYVSLADIDDLKEDQKAAEDILHQGLERYPGNHYILSHLIDHYVNNNNLDEAIKESEGVSDDDLRSSYHLAVSLSKLKVKTGKARAAIEFLSGMCTPSVFQNVKNKHAQSDAYYSCLYLLGELFFKVNNFKKAEENLLLMLKDKPNHFSGAFLLSKVYRKQSDQKKESEILNRILEKNQRLGEYFELVNFYKRQNKQAQIPALFELAKKNLPSTVKNYNRLYEISQRNGIELYIMQYPTFSTDLLKYFTGNRPQIHYVSNEHIFDNAPKTKYFFEPRYPYKFNHYTKEGARILAEHLAEIILKDHRPDKDSK